MTADTNHSSTPYLRIADLTTSLGTLSKAFSTPAHYGYYTVEL